MEYKIPCPICNNEVITTIEWLMENDRVCCMNCNKAFEIVLKKDQERDEKDNIGGDWWD